MNVIIEFVINTYIHIISLIGLISLFIMYIFLIIEFNFTGFIIERVINSEEFHSKIINKMCKNKLNDSNKKNNEMEILKDN